MHLQRQLKHSIHNKQLTLGYIFAYRPAALVQDATEIGHQGEIIFESYQER